MHKTIPCRTKQNCCISYAFIEKEEKFLLFKKKSVILLPFHRNYFVNVSAFISLAFRSEGNLLSYGSFCSAKIAFAPKRNVHFQLGNLCLNVIEKGTDCNKKKIGENT